MSTTALAVESRIATRPASEPWRADLAILLLDVLGILITGGLAVVLRYFWDGAFDPSFYLHLAPLALLYPIALATVGMYPALAVNPVAELRGICQGTTLTFLVFAASTFFQRDATSYSRAVLLLAWILTLIAVPVLRAWGRDLLGRTGWWGAKAVVLGAGETGRAVAMSLSQRPSLGLQVIGLLDEQRAGEARHPQIPILGGFDLAPRLASECGASYAILALPEPTSAQVTEIVERYLWAFRNVLILPDLSGLSSLDARTRDLGGCLGVEVSHRLLYRTPRIFKRVCDLALSVAGGVALLPLFAILCLLIRWSSPGPVFYASRRIGEGGRLFHAWKFRTMVRNGSEVLHRHLAANPALREEYERDQKLKLDPRVTWIGRWLRRTSLDELPQLWNVLRGEMSLVGPRPILESEVARYGSRFQLYQRARPGITGLWQVSGRNNTTYAQRLGFVEYYVRNWSVWLDLYILGKTVKVVLTGDGAY